MVLNKYYKVFGSGLVSVCFSILVAPLAGFGSEILSFRAKTAKSQNSHNVIRDIISSSVLAKILLEIHFWGKWISSGPIGG